MRLQGKVAIVAGGGQGIGEGIVKCLAEEGAEISLVDIKGETAHGLTEKLKAEGHRALAVVADLIQPGQVTRAVKDTIDFFGKIDILVNNVGGSSEDTARLMQEFRQSTTDTSLPPFMYSSPEIWDRFYQLNLKSHVMLSQAVTPYFIKQCSGKIVNIASTSGRIADPTQMHYASMKAADISITWTLAKSLAPYNITVNCICPGFVYTPLWARGATGWLNGLKETINNGGTLPAPLRGITNADLQSLTPKDFWLKYIVLPNTPNGREQTPEDIGKAVAFLVSEDAKNITGQVLNVDGGFVMR